jgi:hypothetical protein
MACQTGAKSRKQLVVEPFCADFDLRGRPAVYKTAALPIELLQRLSKGNGTLWKRGDALSLAPGRSRPLRVTENETGAV